MKNTRNIIVDFILIVGIFGLIVCAQTLMDFENEMKAVENKIVSSMKERQSISDAVASSALRLSDITNTMTEIRTHHQMVSVSNKTTIEECGKILRSLRKDFKALSKTQDKLSTDSKAKIFSIDDKLQKIDSILSKVKARVLRNHGEMVRKMILPSVRITEATATGSGVIIYSAVRGKKDNEYSTYVITCAHVVEGARKVDKDKVVTFKPVSIEVFGINQTVVKVLPGEVELYDAVLDIAIIKIDTATRFNNVAMIASKAEIDNMKVFDPICAVGGPLGNTPMPSRGYITSKRKMYDDKAFWMVSAPGIFGNSGGGVFSMNRYKLIGLYSRLLAYREFITVPVPHLGVIVPANLIRDVLKKKNFAFLYEALPKKKPVKKVTLNEKEKK